MRRITWLSAVALLASGLAFAQEAPTTLDVEIQPGEVRDEAPWTLSIERRLELLRDDEARELRVERFIREQPKEADADFASSFKRRPFDVVVGRENPELLLPTEIFGMLAGILFDSEPTAQTWLHELYQKRANDQGLPSDFVKKLEAIVIPFLIEDRTFREVRAFAGDARQRACESLHSALEQARAEFGASLLDRYLYESVGPSMTITRTTPEDLEELESYARGCK